MARLRCGSLLLALLSRLEAVAADGYVFEEVFNSLGQNGVCEDDDVNRLCTTDRNGGVSATQPGTCIGRNDVGELPLTLCDLSCAQERCELDINCNGYVHWEGGHYGGNWNHRLVHAITDVSVVGGANTPHCFVKRGQ